jgi:demethylmenaquinone methyltransferase/2-methoxy-6-polyprenyl-1,4-benzoquinol methylase
MQHAPIPRPITPQPLFTRVAPYYDALNSLLSAGQDQRWRRRAVAALDLRAGARVLDVATGTGALALELARLPGGVSVCACDLNRRMIAHARLRFQRLGLSARWVRCDAARLPFPDQAFDAVTIAFAMDDMPDRQKCVGEIRRVLRPGGRLALLELAQPEAPWARSAYRLYLRLFRMLRFTRADAYEHLEQEILGYRGATATRDLLARAGLHTTAPISMSLGVVRLHLAEKPAATAGDPALPH